MRSNCYHCLKYLSSNRTCKGYSRQCQQTCFRSGHNSQRHQLFQIDQFTTNVKLKIDKTKQITPVSEYIKRGKELIEEKKKILDEKFNAFKQVIQNSKAHFNNNQLLKIIENRRYELLTCSNVYSLQRFVQDEDKKKSRKQIFQEFKNQIGKDHIDNNKELEILQTKMFNYFEEKLAAKQKQYQEKNKKEKQGERGRKKNITKQKVQKKKNQPVSKTENNNSNLNPKKQNQIPVKIFAPSVIDSFKSQLVPSLPLMSDEKSPQIIKYSKIEQQFSNRLHQFPQQKQQQIQHGKENSIISSEQSVSEKIAIVNQLIKRKNVQKKELKQQQSFDSQQYSQQSRIYRKINSSPSLYEFKSIQQDQHYENNFHYKNFSKRKVQQQNK